MEEFHLSADVAKSQHLEHIINMVVTERLCWGMPSAKNKEKRQELIVDVR